MNSEITISNNIETATLVIKKRSVRKSLYGAVVLLIGFTVCIFGERIESHTSGLFFGVMTLGVALMLWGGSKLLFGAKELVYAATSSPVVEGSYFFMASDLLRLQAAVRSGEFARIAQIPQADEHAGVRMDLQSSADDKFASLQLFHYVPHTYEPLSEPLVLTDDEAGELCRVIRTL